MEALAANPVPSVPHRQSAQEGGMSNTVTDQCPNCDSAMASRRGTYTCGWCGARYVREPDAELVSTSGEVRSSVRVWRWLKGEASDAG